MVFQSCVEKIIESEIHVSNENGQNSNFSKITGDCDTKLLQHKQKKRTFERDELAILAHSDPNRRGVIELR